MQMFYFNIPIWAAWLYANSATKTDKPTNMLIFFVRIDDFEVISDGHFLRLPAGPGPFLWPREGMDGAAWRRKSMEKSMVKSSGDDGFCGWTPWNVQDHVEKPWQLKPGIPDVIHDATSRHFEMVRWGTHNAIVYARMSTMIGFDLHPQKKDKWIPTKLVLNMW